MKNKFKLIVFSLSLVTALNSLADEATAETSTTKSKYTTAATAGFNAEPIWLVLGGIGLKAEYFVTDTVSVGFGGVYIPSHKVESSSDSNSTSSSLNTNYKWEHNEILVGSNIMMTGSLNSNGLYINPSIGYETTKITEYSEFNLSGSLSTAMARFTVGYQWVLAQHLRLAAGGGLAAYQSGTVSVKDNSGNTVLEEKSSSLGGLALDLHVGYVF